MSLYKGRVTTWFSPATFCPPATGGPNWVPHQYGAAGTPLTTYTLTIANTSVTGAEDWLAIDWIELHILTKQ